MSRKKPKPDSSFRCCNCEKLKPDAQLSKFWPKYGNRGYVGVCKACFEYILEFKPVYFRSGKFLIEQGDKSVRVTIKLTSVGVQ